MLMQISMFTWMGKLDTLFSNKQGVPMAELYKWYENELVHETVRAVHQAYNVLDAGNVTNDTNDGYGDLEVGVAEADAAHILIDSDIKQINHITDLEVADWNLSRGLTYAKIGAKFSNCSQPCIRHSAFKVKQHDSHITTAQDKITPLKITIENGMGKLKREGHCILSACKYNVIVNVAATGLAMQGKAYTKEKNQKC
jgi:hypothetical protein